MAKRVRTPKPCAGNCGVDIRPNHWLLADFPGTLPHHAFGLCGRCYREQNPPKATTSKAPASRPSVEQNRASAEAWLKQISADHQRLQRRNKPRMVIK